MTFVSLVMTMDMLPDRTLLHYVMDMHAHYITHVMDIIRVTWMEIIICYPSL